MKRLDRMAAYARYLQLVEDQEEALLQGEQARFDELLLAREDLAQVVDELPAAPDAAAARELLGRCLQADSRMRQRLQASRNEVLNHLRDMEIRRPKVVPYLAAQGAGARLDRVS